MAGAYIEPPRKRATLASVEDELYHLWRQLTERPLLSGRLVEGSVSSASSTLVTHQLGRDYRGAFVVGQSGTVAVYVGRPADTDVATGGSRARNVIVRFASSTTQSFTLWVF